MTMVKQAVVELILLTVASVGVALAANAVRERKSIELAKNYFDKGAPTAQPSTPPKTSGDKPKPPVNTPPEMPAKSAAQAPPVTKAEKATDVAAPGAPKKHLEHDFQTIKLVEVKAVLDDPQTKQGLNIFVDARDDEHFAEGHIPGAMQCFPYEAKRCLGRVQAAAGGAEKVIVYCGGGDCEDSIFMCRELTEAGVPTEAVYLFEGGWKEWLEAKFPVEGGSK